MYLCIDERIHKIIRCVFLSPWQILEIIEDYVYKLYKITIKILILRGQVYFMHKNLLIIYDFWNNNYLFINIILVKSNSKYAYIDRLISEQK